MIELWCIAALIQQCSTQPTADNKTASANSDARRRGTLLHGCGNSWRLEMAELTVALYYALLMQKQSYSWSFKPQSRRFGLSAVVPHAMMAAAWRPPPALKLCMGLPNYNACKDQQPPAHKFG